MDAASLSTSLAHSLTGSMLGDEVRAGASTLTGNLGQGDDVFHFGTGAARFYGGAGNDTFVFNKEAMSKTPQILDFRADLGDGGEHDLLRFEGVSAGAHLDFISASGVTQVYRLVDGGYVSPNIFVAVVNTTAHLGPNDYVLVTA
jgi:Ca2+-binding RTX toxin-like protein